MRLGRPQPLGRENARHDGLDLFRKTADANDELSSVVLWPLTLNVFLALLKIPEGGNPKGVVAESYTPLALVPVDLSMPRGSEVGLEFIRADFVHSHEMLGEFDEGMAVPDAEYVLDAVAVVAEGFESHQPLVAGSFIEMPDLVAVEPRVPSTDLTAIPSALVGRASDLIPLLFWEEFCQRGHCGLGSDWLNREFEVGHVLILAPNLLIKLCLRQFGVNKLCGALYVRALVS